MANIWIITTGNSDVQLKTKDHWNHLSRQVKDELPNSDFELSKNREESYFRAPARALGLVYQNHLDKHGEDLHFPLLDAFTQKLLEKRKTTPDRLIILLTDQAQVFDSSKRKIKKCPYWNDTSTLQPILANYLTQKFPQATQDFLCLQPELPEQGLDSWNEVLLLVQKSIFSLNFEAKDTIYVSHQAGTPAISSAVQFVTLAKFGKKVKFLVSNETESQQEHKSAEILSSSNYLKGLQIEQAKALLKNYNYDAFQELLKDYLAQEATPLVTEIKNLLTRLQNWNYAKFAEFAQEEEWWQFAYEGAYLGVIRMKQGNTVEAFFHTFRAVEGLMIEWAEKEYYPYLEKSNNGLILKDSITQKLPNMKQYFKDKKEIGLYGKVVYSLLQEGKGRAKNDQVMEAIARARNERNNLFHQLLGFDQEDVFAAWDTNNRENWEKMVLECLNLISGKNFTSLKKASLMTEVHRELEEALDKYEL